MARNKKIFIIIFTVAAILALWFFIRFVVGGPEDTWISVKLFYYNPEKDRGDDSNTLCSRKGLVAVKREIPISENPVRDTLNLLLKGELTKEEKAQGITTEYPLIGLTLKNSVLNNGVLILTFNDPNNKTVGGSCRVGILWFQIEATAKQFPEVQKVRFLPEELFQP